MHKGKPSGANKPEHPTGIPTNYSPETQKRDHQVTRKYTENDRKLSEHVRTRHPNRNVNKTDATNGGGYRN